MIAAYVKVNAVLTNLNLASNQLCGGGQYGGGTYDATGITALAEALKVTAVLTNLNLAENQLCDRLAGTFASFYLQTVKPFYS